MAHANTPPHFSSMRCRIGLGTSRARADYSSMHKKPEPKTPLARLMDDRKISANALSRATGIPQPTISRIASGESKAPTDAKLRTIAAYLGVSVERLRGIEPAGTTGLIAREPTTSHSPLALDIATRWMSLSADRQEFFRDLIFTMSFVE